MGLEEFAYHVHYPRTQNWYEDNWRELSEWCTATYGKGNWEYMNSYFLFATDLDALLFKLRWTVR